MSGRETLRLVGRERELDDVRDAFVRAKDGTLQAVLLEGEAGIGKTRLITEAVGYGNDLGFAVYQGAADESDRSRAFGLLTDAFGADPDRRRRLQEVVGRPATNLADRRVGLIDELVGIIEDATASAPVAVVLDDLHWADAEALRVLRALVRREATLPVALVCAARPSPADTELERLVEALVSGGGRHIVLEPLDDAAVGSLVEQLIPTDTPADDVRNRVAAAGGNPFFVIELVSSGLDGRGAGQLPRDLRRSVLRRFAHLSEDAKTVVRLAALLGPTIDIDDLVAVLGRSPIELAPVLEESVNGGVLDDHGVALAFRHDLVRDAVYDDMPEAVRKSAHRNVARALVASGAPARRVATHFHAAADPGDGEAVSWLRRGANEEAERSPSGAAEMLADAIELLNETDPTLGAMQAERVQLLAWAGRVTEASALATELLSTLHDPELATAVGGTLGEALFFSGRVVEATDQLELASANAPVAECGLLLAQAAWGRTVIGQFARARELVGEARAAAAVTNDPRARVLLTGVDAFLTVASADYAGLDLARETVRVADEDPTGEAHRYGPRLYLGVVLTETDRFDEATSVLRRGVRIDETRGVAWMRPLFHIALGQQHYFRGQWDDAVAELETAQALLDEMGSSLYGPAIRGLGSHIAVHRDDRALAERELTLGEAELATTSQVYGVEWLVQTRALLAVDDGDIATATAILRGAWMQIGAVGFHLGYRYLGPTYISLLLSQGETDAARSAAEAVEALTATATTRSVAATALLCRGMVDDDVAALLGAVEMSRSAGRPMELATACAEAAKKVSLRGEPERARELASEAIAVYEALGADRDVRLLSGEVGGRQARRGRAKQDRPVTGWGSLSPTEHRVVALVAEGLSNTAIGERMFISHRTVETHLTHVFRKVGVTSRLELAVQAPHELA